MTPEEIKALVAQEVQAAIAALKEEMAAVHEAAATELADEFKSQRQLLTKTSQQVGAHEKRINSLESKKNVKEPPKVEADKPVIKAPLEIPKKTFKVDGREFKFTQPKFNLGGVMMTAEEALGDEGMLKKLVEMGSGVIREIF